jgi:hypothetical protein
LNAFWYYLSAKLFFTGIAAQVPEKEGAISSADGPFIFSQSNVY